MTNLSRVRLAWSGFTGAPGVSTFYVTDPVAFMVPLHDFLVAIASKVPADVDMQIEAGGDVINDVNGDLVAAWSDAPQTPVSGTSIGGYAGPAGAVVNWLTAVIADGRRIRGRTFLVPLAAAGFETDGSLGTPTRDQLQAAATALVQSSAGGMKVWHRPFDGAPAVGTKPARPAHDGTSATVATAQVPDMVAVLTSRRD